MLALLVVRGAACGGGTSSSNPDDHLAGWRLVGFFAERDLGRW
ncbi:MAG TPA: hypothetical protein VGF64_09090 [Acidimicrobiales bacterium]|jgi:hypothetical protein